MAGRRARSVLGHPPSRPALGLPNLTPCQIWSLHPCSKLTCTVSVSQSHSVQPAMVWSDRISEPRSQDWQIDDRKHRGI
jgi:hypothetical protein